MWFCDMRQMPRLRDCVFELTSNVFNWFRDLFGPREVRRADRRPR